jgi:hypothetical protein
MTDIVERLRFCENYEWSPLMREAAAEIERLGNLAVVVREQGFEIERLTAALNKARWHLNRYDQPAAMIAIEAAIKDTTP